MALAGLQYVQDYDECQYVHRYNCNAAGDFTTGANAGTCTAYTTNGFTGAIGAMQKDRYYWMFILQPYTKSFGIFTCQSNPSNWLFDSTGDTSPTHSTSCASTGCAGDGYGGENSYGHNDLWLSPAAAFAGAATAPAPVTQAQIDRPAGTVEITDSTYYGVAPDVCNATGYSNATQNDCDYSDKQGAQYKAYFANVGNAAWSWGHTAGTAAAGPTTMPYTGFNYNGLTSSAAVNAATADGANRHSGFVNCAFVDGHVKAIRYEKLISDVCLWSTSTDLAHDPHNGSTPTTTDEGAAGVPSTNCN